MCLKVVVPLWSFVFFVDEEEEVGSSSTTKKRRNSIMGQEFLIQVHKPTQEQMDKYARIPSSVLGAI